MKKPLISKKAGLLIGICLVFNVQALTFTSSLGKENKNAEVEFWKKPVTIFDQQKSKPVSKKSNVSASTEGNGLSFTPNMGQIAYQNGKVCNEVLYSSDGDGRGKVFLRKKGISYVITDGNAIMKKIHEEVELAEETGKIFEMQEQKLREELMTKATLNGYRVDVDFEGANENIRTVNSEKVSGAVNFYYPHCKEGITNVTQFNKVSYENVYNNVDVLFYGGKINGMKYDIVIKPGGDPSIIKLKYSGADNIILKDGRLEVLTKIGSVQEWMPKVYQMINGTETEIKATYKLSRNEKNETLISFKLDKYNSSETLIIDPWVTYYGGSGHDWGGSINNDNIGNVLCTGYTESSVFPNTTGAFQITYGGGQGDVFILSMQPNGTTRNFCTFYGGSGLDIGTSLCADAGNNVIVCGTTSSFNLPTGATGANSVFQSSSGEGFIIKFNNTGARQFATYYNAYCYDLSCDNSNDIIVAGLAGNAGLATTGAYQQIYGGGYDAFAAKFLSNGNRSWCTYVGGSLYDNCYGVCLDKSTNEVYITGFTKSTNFPVLSGHQMTNGGGQYDAFVSKINSAGTSLVWSTYYGGVWADFGTSIGCDNVGNVVLAGHTNGAPLGVIATAGAAQSTYGGGGYDAMIVKFNSAGVRQWGTYMGDWQTDYCSGIDIDNLGNIVTGGDTYSAGGLPVTSCAFQSTFGGSEDQWIATYDPSGKLSCLSYLGGGNMSTQNNETWYDGGSCVSVYGCKTYIIAGSPGTYPTTSNAFQTTAGGGYDIAIAQFDINSCGAPVIPLVNSNTKPASCICSGSATLNLTAGCKTPPFSYSYSNGAKTLNTSSLTDSITNICPGSYNYTVTTMCDTITGNFVISGGTGALTAIFTQTDISCSSNTGGITITGVTNGISNFILTEGTNTLAANFNVPYVQNGISSGLHTYKIIDANGCSSIFNVTINNATTNFNVNAPTPVTLPCSGGAVNLNCNTNASGAVNYLWTGPGIVSGANTAIVSVNLPGSYTITVSQGLCTNSTVVNVIDNKTIVSGQILGNNKGCAPFCSTFTLATANGSGTMKWDFGDGSFSTNVNPVDHCYDFSGSHTITNTFSDANGCVGKASLAVEVYLKPVAYFTYSPLTSFISEPEVTFTDASHGAVIKNWNWYFMNLPKPSSDIQNPKYTYTQPGQYNVSLIVTSDHGCKDTAIRPINILDDYGIFVPNAFTPNGDGLDDIFQPKGVGFENYEFAIFDRWGEKLFSTTEFNMGWDGTYKGKLSPFAVYVWKISLRDNVGKFHELNGHVTLLK